MYNYFFHKDNNKKAKEIEEEFKKVLNKKLYQSAMKNVKIQYLSIYQKIVLKNAKRRRIKILKILKKLKIFLKILTLKI